VSVKCCHIKHVTISVKINTHSVAIRTKQCIVHINSVYYTWHFQTDCSVMTATISKEVDKKDPT
jgi:hypothetical protein